MLDWMKRRRSSAIRKPVDKITMDDLRTFPVWEYANDEEGVGGRDETWMKPVLRLPVASLDNRIVGTEVRLAGGRQFMAALSNVDLDDPSEREHFLVLGLYRSDGGQFILARYHDHNAQRQGPEALAAFLELPIEEVFPISYDLSAAAKGSPSSLRGTIEARPSNVLSRADVIKRAVQKS
jgi:hypothetical protein